MKAFRARRGSALLLALWIIAVLSVMVLAFSVEARQQAGVKLFVRERYRINRLVDAGKVLAELVISDFSNVKDWSEDEKTDELIREDDRWLLEKRELKSSSKCTIGPILLDAEHPESGTVTVDIELADSGETSGININNLCEEKDTNWKLRWDVILSLAGLPEDFEIDDEDDGRQILSKMLQASWNDWRDSDDNVTQVEDNEGRGNGAEATWYKELYEDDEVEEEDRRYPRNGPIPDVKELQYIRGFRKYPAILTGGVLNPEAKKEEQISVTGIAKLFGTMGSSKVNVNDCTVEQLMTVPGIFPVDSSDSAADTNADAKELAQAILNTLRVKPDRDDIDETRDWWPYKDWNDLTQRLLDNPDCSDVADELGSEAQNYLTYVPEKTSLFTITITGESMGMKKKVVATGYLKDQDVRYIKWRED